MATNLNIVQSSVEVSLDNDSLAITNNNTDSTVNIIGTNTSTIEISSAGILGNPGKDSDVFLGNSVYFTNITASSNISASGNLIGDQLIIGGGIFTSASLAAAQASGDDLGNHTATQNLNMGGFNITSSKNIIGSTGSFAQTVITLESGAEDSPFIITIADNNGQDNKLEMTKDGILKFGALDTLPTAITGGLVYSASAFYAGL
jgi:hypothetical protein